MQEIPANSLANIHFPQRTIQIKRFRRVSFILNDIILVSSLVVLFAWIFNIRGMYDVQFQNVGIFPFSSFLFILSGITLLFGAKRHLIGSNNETHKEEYSWWNTWIPIVLALITAGLGLINFLKFTDLAILSLIRISPFEGFCFFLIGLALIPPFTRILHRFHITQFILFIVSGLNVFVVLEFIYQLFSPFPLQQLIPTSLISAFMFVIFCFGILLRWTNRGFIGNFTLDSTGSVFAFRLMLINLMTAPLIALLILTVIQTTSYNMYQLLTIVIVCFTAVSCSILWINVKLLYSYELEHLLMRESLRTHNINLATEQEELKKRMVQIEQEKQQYLEKLNIQKSWRDTADISG